MICWREVPEDICLMYGWNHKKATNSKHGLKNRDKNIRHYLIPYFEKFVSTSRKQCVSFGCASKHETQHFNLDVIQVLTLSKLLCQPIGDARMNMT